MGQIPVIILSGFLGSGKTTLLLRLLHEASSRELDPAVLMNELGTIDVDGRLVNATMEENQVLEKLLDGCICCSKKSEVVESIEKLLLTNPDVIIIELTGVANPEEVADMLTEPQLKERVALHTVLTTLDSFYYLEYTSIFEMDRQLVRTVKRQVEVADVIVVNKTEGMKESHRARLTKALRKQNNRSPIVYTTYSEIDLAPVFAPIGKQSAKLAGQPSPFRMAKSADHTHEHAHQTDEDSMSYSRIQTVTFPVEAPANRRAVERFLKSYHPHLLRAKGYMPAMDKSGIQLLQYAAKRSEWETVEDTGEHYLVLIGIDLDIEGMLQAWNALGMQPAQS